jgi:ATP-dependent DNA helicase PIF1
MFDKLEHVARSVRASDEAFGGVQLIVCGDFLQLPPVMKGQSSNDKYFFAFEAEAWGRCFAKQVALTKVFRQKVRLERERRD